MKSNKNPSETFSDKFNAFLNLIPHCLYQDTLNNLSLHCEKTRTVIYNWRSGKTFISKTDRDAIEAFFNKKIF